MLNSSHKSGDYNSCNIEENKYNCILCDTTKLRVL